MMVMEIADQGRWRRKSARYRLCDCQRRETLTNMLVGWDLQRGGCTVKATATSRTGGKWSDRISVVVPQQSPDPSPQSFVFLFEVFEISCQFTVGCRGNQRQQGMENLRHGCIVVSCNLDWNYTFVVQHYVVVESPNRGERSGFREGDCCYRYKRETLPIPLRILARPTFNASTKPPH